MIEIERKRISFLKSNKTSVRENMNQGRKINYERLEAKVPIYLRFPPGDLPAGLIYFRSLQSKYNKSKLILQ